MSDAALAALVERERDVFRAARPRSVEMAAQARQHLPGGVPMHWMRDWPMPVPMYLASARGAALVDVDDNHYIDFCLGDTGAMFGHSPAPVAGAISAQVRQGLTTMLPSLFSASVGERLAALFGLRWWQVTQTASDANRAVLRLARMLTGRPRVLVFDGCYHGAVDETLAVLGEDGETRPRSGQVGRAHDPSLTTVVVPFNDPDAVTRALARGDVACVLAEPVMTNAGMVLPQPGFLDALRQICDTYDVTLAIDETHTLSSGLGGYARVQGLAADFLVCGKAVAGGFPCAVFGYSDVIAQRIDAGHARREPGHSGIGTTLAANPLAMAALHAALQYLHTPVGYAHMERGAARLASGIGNLIVRHGLHWHVSRVGARLEFAPGKAPRTARESLVALNRSPQQALHLFLLNRGILLTPFHNMMLVSPATTDAQIDATLSVLDDAFAALERWMTGT